MMRKRKITPQLRASGTRCPCCGKRFSDVLRHLNHRQSKCANWFNDISSSPSLLPQSYHNDHDIEDAEPAPQDYPMEPSGEPEAAPQRRPLYRVEFPRAGVTYGRATTFMDRFNNDEHSGSRTNNIYYPFAGKDEWEIGSFLHSSGLSMRKIDEFLKLKMVNGQLFSIIPIYLSSCLGQRRPCILLNRKGAPRSGGNAPKGS